MPTTPLSSNQLLEQVFNANRNLGSRYDVGINRGNTYSSAIQQAFNNAYGALKNSGSRSSQRFVDNIQNKDLLDAIRGHASFNDTVAYENQQQSYLQQLKPLDKAFEALSAQAFKANGTHYKPSFTINGTEYENSEVGKTQARHDFFKNNAPEEAFKIWQQQELRRATTSAGSLIQQREGIQRDIDYALAHQNDPTSNKANKGNRINQLGSFYDKLNQVNNKLKLYGVEPNNVIQSEVGMKADTMRNVRQGRLDRKISEGNFSDLAKREREQRLIGIQDQLYRTGTGKQALFDLQKERGQAGDFKLNPVAGYTPSNVMGEMGTYANGRPRIRFGVPMPNGNTTTGTTGNQNINSQTTGNQNATTNFNPNFNTNSNNMPNNQTTGSSGSSGIASTNPQNNVTTTSNPITPNIQNLLNTLPQGQQQGYMNLLNSGNPTIVRNTLNNLRSMGNGNGTPRVVGGQNTGGQIGAYSGASTGSDRQTGSGIYTNDPSGSRFDQSVNAVNSPLPDMTENAQQMYNYQKDYFNTASLNFSERMMKLAQSKETNVLDAAREYQSGLDDIIQSYDRDIGEYDAMRRNTERTFENTRSGELATNAENRQKMERDTILERKLSMDEFNSSIREQRSSVIRERLRNETFAGLKGNFAGSAAALENLGAAEQAGRSVLAGLQTAKARSGEKFANIFNDISDKYLQNIRAINSTADEKVANLRLTIQQQIQAIKSDKYATKEQKAKAYLEARNSIEETKTAIGLASAQSAFNTALQVGNSLQSAMAQSLEEKKFEYQQLQDSMARRGGGGGGGGGELSDFLSNFTEDGGDTGTSSLASQMGEDFPSAPRKPKKSSLPKWMDPLGLSGKAVDFIANKMYNKKVGDYNKSLGDIKNQMNEASSFKKTYGVSKGSVDQLANNIVRELKGKYKGEENVKFDSAVFNSYFPKGTPAGLKQLVKDKVLNDL